jgi:hypothetical protein
MARQRQKVLSLFGEALEGSLAVAAALIDDGVEPSRELGPHVLEVDEGAAVEERALDLPETALDTRLGIGVAPHGERMNVVVSVQLPEFAPGRWSCVTAPLDHAGFSFGIKYLAAEASA